MWACPKGTSCARGDGPESGVFSSTQSRGGPAYPEPLRNPVKGAAELLPVSVPDARPRHGYEIGKLIEASKAPYC